MKLRNRILISIFILLVLPIITGIVGMLLIVNYQDLCIEKQYGLNDASVSTIANPLKLLEVVTSKEFEKVKVDVEENPGIILDKRYLQRLNEKLEDSQSFIVVRVEDSFFYIGDEELFSKIDQSIPEYGKYTTESPAYYMGGAFPCLYRQKDILLEDGTKTSIVIITNLNRFIPQVKKMAIQVLVTLILIIIFTAVILILWIYKSMLRPLNGLSRAAGRIKNGDLDFTIKDETEDEIGTLCSDFEEMRIKLKEFIEKQQMYENESRELISNISHDLKTPLTAIKGYTEGLIDGVADTKQKQDKYLKTIYTKACDMTLLVDELSIYSKIDCDSLPYNFTEIGVDDYFKDCMDEIALDTEIKGIRVSYFNYCNQGKKVVADPEQVKRVINNIVNNSMKYIDKEKGIINIRIYEIEDGIRVEIEDNGIGIAKEDLQFVFDRFYRTDASRNSAAKGTGLGLSIAKKIIEDHEGKIWISSKENVGTTIYFTLKDTFTQDEQEDEDKADKAEKSEKNHSSGKQKSKTKLKKKYIWKRGK